jgi:hypothetical protein
MTQEAFPDIFQMDKSHSCYQLLLASLSLCALSMQLCWLPASWRGSCAACKNAVLQQKPVGVPCLYQYFLTGCDKLGMQSWHVHCMCGAKGFAIALVAGVVRVPLDGPKYSTT